MTTEAAPILDVRGLCLDFDSSGGESVRVLHGLDLAISAGETLALVGESGSGKSATSLAIMGLLDRRTAQLKGEVRLATDGPPRDLLKLSRRELQRVRGRDAAMIFQEPMTSLNPVQRVGKQIAEGLRLHQGFSGRALDDAVAEALREVGIPDPARRARAFPHELSGGMRQRVLIALALACGPSLLIADEPTTALDVTVQAQVLALLRGIQRARGMAMLFITHSLAVVAQIADRVAVMYAGRIVEEGRTADLFMRPRHPYTLALLQSLPEAAEGEGRRGRLRAIRGAPVDPRKPPAGCAFHPRCDWAFDPCHASMPPLAYLEAGRAARCLRAAEP